LDDKFRDYVKQETLEFIKQKSDFEDFLKKINYSKVELTNQEDYETLKNDIEKLQNSNSQVVFYLSIAPEFFASFVDNYKFIDIKNTKIIFEKPF
jgi:glucose-6-phosphate 1-dehydrogenase